MGCTDSLQVPALWPSPQTNTMEHLITHAFPLCIPMVFLSAQDRHVVNSALLRRMLRCSFPIHAASAASSHKAVISLEDVLQVSLAWRYRASSMCWGDLATCMCCIVHVPQRLLAIPICMGPAVLDVHAAAGTVR